MGRRKWTGSLFGRNGRGIIYYYELDPELTDSNINYVYDSNFDYLLSAISIRVFELVENTLFCVTGDTTYYYVDPKEATYIILSAHPKTNKIFSHFDPGHA